MDMSVVDAVNKLRGEWPSFTTADASIYHTELEYHYLGCKFAIVRVKGGKNVMWLDFLECVKDMIKNK